MAQAIQALGAEGCCFEHDYFWPEQAQRAIDFVAGATCAIDARPNWLANTVYF